jgi:hypothetical protein
MIRLNFLAFKNQEFGITIYRKKKEDDFNENSSYYVFKDEAKTEVEYDIKFESTDGFEEYQLPAYAHTHLVSKSIYDKLINALPKDLFFIKNDNEYNRKIHFFIEQHPKGKKCIWVEPYFLKGKSVWGILFDYCFVADKNDSETFKIDKDILIASGTLNAKGNSNVDFYLFKHNYLSLFIKRILPEINKLLGNNLSIDLLELENKMLAPKTYVFGNSFTNISSYLGLSKNPPLEALKEEVKFYFIYRKADRDIAVSLLKGLRGESNPTTFNGMEKLFRINFSNERIKGAAIETFSDENIEREIRNIREFGTSVIPVIITNSKRDEEDDKLYYRLKHKFTNEGIPCQVVTKELIGNDYSLKYSLSNIGLQIFAKAGGKPWKMRPATNEYLIIGIGQSYNLEPTENGNIVKKNLTYSVLTDSSGIFKDIQVLGEGVDNEDNYYKQLVKNISNIIIQSGYKKVSIHVPFRLSKEKILNKVIQSITFDIELTVLVINAKNDYFGFDYNNNGLVPFESSYVKIASDEFLVWFEGLQFNNPKITKRFGNPLLIKFWYTNKPELFKDYLFKENLLQDCINLSGANWRGFKAKQLPVSVFYCQRIAEFIAKFRHYHLSHIEINNLRPWFL